MEKRDYIESMIEQMGLFFRKLLLVLTNDIGTLNEEKTIHSIAEGFLNEFNISIDGLIALNELDFKKFILKLKLKETHIESLSQLFYQMSFHKKFSTNKIKLLNEKTIVLLDIADFISNSYSIDRINKKKLILSRCFGTKI
jgi:hypothetical protein